MKNISAKKIFLVLMAVNALLVLGTIGVFAYASNIAEQKSQKIAQEKADLESNDQLLSDYKVLKANIESNKDIEDISQKVLPSDKDQSAAFADLDQFSRETNMPIQQITFNPGTNKGNGKTLTSPSGIKGVSVISVNLHSASARYNNLLFFLKKIENTQRRMQITSITISPDAKDPNLLSTVEITLDIYLKASN